MKAVIGDSSTKLATAITGKMHSIMKSLVDEVGSMLTSAVTSKVAVAVKAGALIMVASGALIMVAVVASGALIMVGWCSEVNSDHEKWTKISSKGLREAQWLRSKFFCI